MSARKALPWLVLLALTLMGCKTAPAAAPLLKPETVVVQLTPALRGLAPQLNACARETPGIGTVVIERPASALDLKAAGVALRWGQPPSVPGYAAIVGWDRLAFIARPDSKLSKLTPKQIQGIYAGAADASLPVQEIHPWAYSPGDDAQQALATLLKQAPKPGITALAPDPEAMRQAVAEDPAAVGFVPARYLDNSVKEITVDGSQPGDARLPVLALSPSEPQGSLRQWLGCLQEKLK